MSPLSGGESCWNHALDREADRKQSRRLGGLHRRRTSATDMIDTPIMLSTVSAIITYLQEAAQDLRRCDSGVARARAQIHLASVVMKAVELDTIERRLTALEARYSTTGQ
jgi:hypothetical protein